jgi:hypothetical protein
MTATVVDADGHVLEPPSAWETAPADHRPRIHRDDAGYEHVIVADKEIVAVSIGLLATPGSNMA